MSPHSRLIQTIIDNINEQMTFIEKAVIKTPKNKLWEPLNENSNSVGIICQHLCGNLKQYVLSGLSKIVDDRQRDNEFTENKNTSNTEVLESLQQVIDKVIKQIESLPEEQMHEKHQIQGIEIDTLEVLLHISHHLAYHTGQIVYITKLITNKQLNLFADRDLNLKNA